MRVFRNIFWVPMVFGILLGGLAIARIILSGIEQELVGMPASIMQTYSMVADTLMYFAIEAWFDVDVPVWARDLIIIWLVVGATNLRAVSANNRLFNLLVFLFLRIGRSDEKKLSSEVLDERYRAFRKFQRYQKELFGPDDSRVQIGMFRYFLVYAVLYLSGPLFWLSAFRVLYVNARILRQTVSLPKSNPDGRSKEWHDVRVGWNDAATRYSINMGLRTYVLVLLANPVIAALLLWWNSAEIERLSSGL